MIRTFFRLVGNCINPTDIIKYCFEPPHDHKPFRNIYRKSSSEDNIEPTYI